MAKGFCSSCGKEVGTFLRPLGYQCERCKKIFCKACSPKIGLIFKSPACPDCGIELRP
jgi:DNA-directed RNA polymerase subunit RPC12/RpoP